MDFRSFKERVPGQLFVFCCLLIVLVGCQTSQWKDQSGEERLYFDLEGLVEQQIVRLEAEQPEVTKLLIMNGNKEMVTSRSVNWREDLGFFIDSDINNPSLRDSYLITKPDSITEEYSLKEGAEFPIQKIKIVKDFTTEEVQEIIIFSGSENRLFDTARELRMKLSGQKGDSKIVSYTIKGSKRLVVGEGDDFEVRASIKW